MAASTELARQALSSWGVGVDRGEVSSAAATSAGVADGISSGSTGGHPKRVMDRPASFSSR